MKSSLQWRRNQWVRSSVPILKAYGLAYLSITVPKLLNFLFFLTRKRQLGRQFLTSLYNILEDSFALHKFPTFCAALVSGFIFLQKPIHYLFRHACVLVSKSYRQQRIGQRLEIAIVRFLAALVSAWLTLPLLNAPRRVPEGHQPAVRPVQNLEATKTQISPQRTGKTIDLTLFAATRALDAIVVNLWRHRFRQSPHRISTFSKVLSYHTDTVVFVASCSTIMWSWFYHPQRLPRAYNKWIASAAQVDPRLIEALRLARRGDFVYGKDKGPDARICEEMCIEYGWPVVWGDPQRTIPLPCEMVHMGSGPSCHWHACARFSRTFQFAMATNLPLQLLARIVAKGRLSLKDLVRVAVDSARSSAFLGAFVALFYYGICLSRTQLGPRLFSEKTISRQDWDSGLCVRVACVLCGWSVLIEKETRRGELAMFVAPRAAATILPRNYDRRYFWRERAAFSVSTALIFTLAKENKGMVRGVLGRLLNSVLA